MSSSILFPTNEYTSSSKSSQQIQKLMIPDDVPQCEVISYLLNKNHPLQMPYVYRNFHKYYKGVIPIICQKASSQQPQNQIIICQSLKKVLLKEKFISVSDLDLIFKMCLQCMNNLNSPANEPLAEILELMIKVHPSRHSVLAKIESEILELGKNNQPTISKVTSGRLIAIVSKHIGKMIKGQMIDILKKIITDNEIQARKVWVGEIFPKLLQGLQLDFVELHLQQKIYECIYDQNEQIGLISLKVILKNVTRFSIEQQSSRIVKLFIDSLTSKNEKICLMVTQIMGQIYQKLINIIMKNQTNCSKFWRSLVQLAQCKNQKVLNNLVYNLPGILLLSSKFHKTDPFVEIYCQLFYQPLVDKKVLISYCHEIVYLYPNKKEQLKQVVYWIFGELFDEGQDDYDIQAIKIINNFIKNVYKSKALFFVDVHKQLKESNNLITNYEDIPLANNRGYTASSQKCLSSNTSKTYLGQSETNSPNQSYSSSQSVFQIQFCQYLFKYLQLLQYHKNSQWLNTFFQAVKQVADFLPLEWVEKSLLPKLYNSIKSKAGPIEVIVETMVLLLRRDGSNLMNYYASKIHVQFSKSNKSHERFAAIQFLYYCSFYFSMETFQQYKLGQKFLNFNNDKSFHNKELFIKYLQRIQYFLTREEKLQAAIIISRLLKDSDSQIVQIINQIDFTQKEQVKQHLIEQSKLLKEKQKHNVIAVSLNQQNKSLKPIVNNRRQSKQLKKEQILKKRIQTTKSKTKMLIKQVSKKKTINFGSSMNNKTSTNFKRNS